MSTDEIAEFEKFLTSHLPVDIRELLSFTRGIQWAPPCIREIDFANVTRNHGFAAAFPEHVVIGCEDSSTHWVVDIDPATGAWGRVYYATYMPYEILLQAESLGDFLGQVFQDSPGDIVGVLGAPRERTPTDLPLRNDPAVQNDSVLRDFAAELPDDFRIADLRSGKPGDGFAWSFSGHDPEIRRHPSMPVFAVRYEKHQSLLGWVKGPIGKPTGQ
ncbi:MAG: SMI1/KNR4 family protein [Myxococcales bacterium]|nr:SMI1/KNR4 family protein [Myxococcales bacterium]